MLLLVALVGFGSIASAQSFTASVSKNPVAVGERFQLTFELNTTASGFQGPNLSAFNILGGPNQGSSSTRRNGKVTSTSTFIYMLSAKKAGNFKIQGARVKTGNKTFQAKSVTVKVGKGPGQKQAQNKSGATKNTLFLKSVLSKNKAYVGEAVIVTHYLYTTLSIVQVPNLHLPSYNGFWTEMVAREEIPVTKEVLDGVKYTRIELSKTILFPHKSGKLKIEATDVEAIIRTTTKRRSNDIFENFFGSRYEDTKSFVKGQPITIEILPLPLPAPASYKGNVGNYTFALSVDKTNVKTNDAINFTIQLKGSGNVKLLEVPTIEFPTDFEVYDPKVNNKTKISDWSVSGYKSFEYLTIMRQPGTFTFKPVEFTYFDPAKKSYITLASDEIIINVEKGSDDNGGSVHTSPNKKDVQFIGKDIRHINTGNLSLTTDGKLFFQSPLFYSLLGGPFLLFIGLIGYQKKSISDNKNGSLIKKKKAGKAAAQKLKAAKSFMDAQDSGAFYDELSKAMLGYLADKFSISGADMSKEVAKSSFASSNIEQAVSDDFIAIIDECEMARYSSGGNSANMQDVYLKAEKTINEIEKQVK